MKYIIAVIFLLTFCSEYSYGQQGKAVQSGNINFDFCCRRHDGTLFGFDGILAFCDYCKSDFKYKVLSYEVIFKNDLDSVFFTIKNSQSFSSEVKKFYKLRRHNYDTIVVQKIKLKVSGRKEKLYPDRFSALLSLVE